MDSRTSPDVIDPRLFYWIYAAIAWVAGVVLAARPLWFGADLPGHPWGMAALVRLFGAFIIAVGCFAASLASMEDARARRPTHAWFLAANVAIFVMFIAQQHSVWGGGPAEYAAQILFVVVLLGVLFGIEATGIDPAASAQMITLFGRTRRRPSMRQMQSRYEQQIRQAAGQEERNRLARELHDSIKQQLFVVQTAAATVQARWDDDTAGAKSALDQVRSSARDAMIEMEVLLDQLRAAPLENVGLVEALKKQCEALGLRTGASVSFEPGMLPAATRLVPGTQQAVFRVAQEALANIARHARASRVRVSLEGSDDEIRLRIEDDGSGFDLQRASQGMGLENMRERAAEFDGDLVVRSQPGSGTTLSLAIGCLPEGVEIPDHRLQARIWAVMLVCQVALGVWKPDILIMALVPAAFLVRALAHLRQRRRSTERR